MHQPKKSLALFSNSTRRLDDVRFAPGPRPDSGVPQKISTTFEKCVLTFYVPFRREKFKPSWRSACYVTFQLRIPPHYFIPLVVKIRTSAARLTYITPQQRSILLNINGQAYRSGLPRWETAKPISNMIISSFSISCQGDCLAWRSVDLEKLYSQGPLRGVSSRRHPRYTTYRVWIE